MKYKSELEKLEDDLQEDFYRIEKEVAVLDKKLLKETEMKSTEEIIIEGYKIARERDELAKKAGHISNAEEEWGKIVKEHYEFLEDITGKNKKQAIKKDKQESKKRTIKTKVFKSRYGTYKFADSTSELDSDLNSLIREAENFASAIEKAGGEIVLMQTTPYSIGGLFSFNPSRVILTYR